MGVVGDVNDGDLESEYDDMEEDESIPFKRTVDCISDCLCDFFQDSAFDIQSIVALSELFFESEQFSSQTPHSIDTIKTKVITRLVIKIFVAAALSKSQMDTMNKLIKAILAFASPKNEEIARGVHASYLSCRRGTKKHHREMDLYVENCFETCKYFSLAVDTALFGQEHVLSCTSRFMFDDRFEQFTLFYSVCHGSTGEELGHFVYNKLKQYNVPFSKLVSVASDGAKNMIGAVNGMIPHLSRLIRQECHVDQAPFKNIWCLAHRLNLVITDFTRVPYINSVFLFANWFTTKRKAVQYKKWLSEKYPNHHFKKIPKPSETRWSFYKDVLVSLLTQVQIIDEYLHQDQEFPMTVQKMTPLFVSARSSSPFISNTFVIAHFSFAKFLLERIWNLNTKMQEEYATLPVLWEQVSNFKEEMCGYLGEMKNDCFQRFEYIMGLENSQKATFLHVMEMMVLNLDIRFPCPGFSIETGLAKRNRDTTTHFAASILQEDDDEVPFCNGGRSLQLPRNHHQNTTNQPMVPGTVP